MTDELISIPYLLLLRERDKQIVCGFDATHDDAHSAGELARMAAYFAMPGTVSVGFSSWKFQPDFMLGELVVSPKLNRSTPIAPLEQDASANEMADYCERRIRDLVKGGACIIAEIERLQRVAIVARQKA